MNNNPNSYEPNPYYGGMNENQMIVQKIVTPGQMIYQGNNISNSQPFAEIFSNFNWIDTLSIFFSKIYGWRKKLKIIEHSSNYDFFCTGLRYSIK